MRGATCQKGIEKALSYIQNNNCPAAQRALTAMLDKLQNKGKSPKAPNKYALYVKEVWAETKSKNPNKSATEIMQIIAADWKKKNGR